MSRPQFRHLGKTADAPVDTRYLLRGSQNVYVTGGRLMAARRLESNDDHGGIVTDIWLIYW